MPVRNGQFSSAFPESVQLLIRLHGTMIAADPNGSEADTIRDAMEQPWHAMSAAEQELVGELSEDLYTIGVDRGFSSELPAISDTELASAFTDNRAEQLLEILRKHQLQLPPEQTAALRGICWARLGQPGAAMPFFEEAARITGQNLIPT